MPMSGRPTDRVTPVLSISVVIPVLDEVERIGRRLDELSRTPGLAEILVVDGGGTDGTPAAVRSGGGARLLAAPRGRGPQMNAGAAVARGDVLLFQHADVALPADAARWIGSAFQDPQTVAGAFRTETRVDSGRSRLAPLLRVADVRSRWSGLPYGDQALFVRAAAFRAVGGFPDQPLMEDLELARRLRRIGRIRTVPAEVQVSGRRFLRRPLHSLLVMNTFPALYRLGVPARVLAAWYGDPR